MYLAPSLALARSRAIATLMGGPVGWAWPGRRVPANATLIGWGRKKSGRLAQARGAPFLLLEDGFLRGLYPSDPPLSVVVDDLGIYYDAREPSRLETLIAQPLTQAQAARAHALIAAWRAGGVSKHNAAADHAGPLRCPYVLVVDQVRGDASVAGGLANAGTFARMLEAARTENPGCAVVIKRHPAGRGYFSSGPEVIEGDVHPACLIADARAVYTVTSQMGFEALLHGVPVRCFGMPFYAGWGLTRDDLPAPTRRGCATLEQLAHAALIAYPRYRDPESGVRCEVEGVLAHLALQRRARARLGPGPLYAPGLPWHKRRNMARFTQGAEVRFAKGGGSALLWGTTPAPPRAGPVIRVEDGFLRSAGLGAALVQPLSWVFDDLGLHYDPTRPSRLEHILQNTDFTEADLARAARLRAAILEGGVTKYALPASATWTRPPGARRVVLVPGQVPGDAALRLAATGLVKGNADLLAAVRAAEPGAHILYKPHPDVVAGLREGDGDLAPLCDAVVVHGDIAPLLPQVDAVHVVSSLAGFEALLRGVPVVCWGAPFYAGWGLTDNRGPVPARRTRRLALDTLAYGALIAYPIYVSRVTGRYTTPERVVAEIAAWRESVKVR
ncbi:MAG TPA: beta-3-deoxy-D-manno-oct-2-ulosonic acid transferase [Rhodospirillaceae bacterium]|jgi:capsular polysaccharide export protein|nr:capsular polysaccharide biosynthesis protein [Alphaproteobacteria bacterium]HBH26449.1 beta-3-deoxy-D-manno-oct-2-ulosonic acid transferase [Rhodospirillaceae bacterium]